MKLKDSILILLIAAVLLLGYLLQRQAQKANDLEAVAAWRADTVKIWQDKAGRFLIEKSALQVNSRIAKEQLKSEIWQVQHDLDIARHKIASLTKATSTTEGSIVFDSHLNYRDDFSSFSLVDTGGAYHLRYSITDSLLITAYYERAKFWKAKQLRVRAISYNPNTRLTGLDHVQIKNQPSRFAVSLHAGYGITTAGLSPYIGIGVGYDLWRF